MRLRFITKSSGEAGFTLIEVLVSLTLLALIGTLLIQLIFGARRALNFVDRANAEAPVVAVQRYLRDALEQVMVSDPTASGNWTSLGVLGNSSHITFTTSHSPLGAYQGIYRVIVGPEPNSRGGLDLIAKLELVRPEKQTAESPHRTRSMLLPNIANVSFSYFARRHDDQVSAWEPSWESGVPNLVSMNVTFRQNDGRTWQPLTVAVAAASTYGIRCPVRVTCD